MVRTTPPDRIEKLIAAAAATFVDLGYVRTQMDDIAAKLGVAKGTIYRSVESKDALFGAVLMYGDDPSGLDAVGPVLRPPRWASVSEHLQAELTERIGALELARAATRRSSRSTSIEAAVQRMSGEVYDMLFDRRVTVMVLDRCAREIPVITGDWYVDGRYALVDLWTAYLAQLGGHLRPTAHPEVIARTIVELTTTWAVKMPWEPFPRAYPANMRDHVMTMVADLVCGGKA